MKNKNIIAAYLLEGELAQKLTLLRKEFIPLSNAMLDAAIALEDTLTKEQKILFNKYDDLIMEYRDAKEELSFSEGFKAGITIQKKKKGHLNGINY